MRSTYWIYVDKDVLFYKNLFERHMWMYTNGMEYVHVCMDACAFLGFPFFVFIVVVRVCTVIKTERLKNNREQKDN